MHGLDDWISRGHERLDEDEETAPLPPRQFLVPSRKEITMRHGTPEQFPLIHRLRDQLEALNEDRPINLCPHKVNIDQAGCGQCLDLELRAQDASNATATAMQLAARRIGGMR